MISPYISHQIRPKSTLVIRPKNYSFKVKIMHHILAKTPKFDRRVAHLTKINNLTNPPNYVVWVSQSRSHREKVVI